MLKYYLLFCFTIFLHSTIYHIYLFNKFNKKYDIRVMEIMKFKRRNKTSSFILSIITVNLIISIIPILNIILQFENIFISNGIEKAFENLVLNNYVKEWFNGRIDYVCNSK